MEPKSIPELATIWQDSSALVRTDPVSGDQCKMESLDELERRMRAWLDHQVEDGHHPRWWAAQVLTEAICTHRRGHKVLLRELLGDYAEVPPAPASSLRQTGARSGAHHSGGGSDDNPPLRRSSLRQELERQRRVITRDARLGDPTE